MGDDKLDCHCEECSDVAISTIPSLTSFEKSY